MATYSEAEQRRLDQGASTGPMPPHNNSLTVRQAHAELARIAGRQYRIALALLDEESLRQFIGLLRDLAKPK